MVSNALHTSLGLWSLFISNSIGGQYCLLISPTEVYQQLRKCLNIDVVNLVNGCGIFIILCVLLVK